MYKLGDNFGGQAFGRICLLARGGEYQWTEEARGDGSKSESQPKVSPVHDVSALSFRTVLQSSSISEKETSTEFDVCLEGAYIIECS